MNAPFFITGLPRSRSAWLANFFTTQNSFCFHDAMKDGWTANHIGALMTGLKLSGYEHYGDADSGLLLVAGELVEMFPQARWLFVNNPPERAAASYRKWFTPGNEYPGVSSAVDIERMMENIWDIYTKARALVPIANKREIAMEMLDQPKVMRDVWDWLTPVVAWDERRYRMLDTMCVNILPHKISVAALPKVESRESRLVGTMPPHEGWTRDTFYAGKNDSPLCI